ncbi:VOC family protein [Clavibacter sp. Sh2141]|uniref:VOC family protein n=1 Tax=Clavibacter sp. Sh2141 TaxID=3395374 RepID=UPI0039BCC57D
MSAAPVARDAVPALLDHVVIAGPDLAALVAWFAERTGVEAEPGGVHPSGTANALVAFTVDGVRGPWYLELIGPDPARVDRAMPTRFGIAELTAPRVVTYAVHPAGIADVAARARERGEDPGPVSDLSRRTPDGTLLAWRLTHPRGDRPDVPFLIDWGSTPQPGTTVGPAVELLAFTQTAGDPTPTEAARAALDLPPGSLADLAAGPRDGYALRVRRADGTPVDL